MKKFYEINFISKLKTVKVLHRFHLGSGSHGPDAPRP